MDIITKDALELASENYREYSKYIAEGRAYPCLIDGAKSVQKRVIYSLYKKAPRSIIKVAEAAGYCLDMHPHPTAVPEVIVALGDNGNKFKFVDTQGNFGHRAKNIEASAPRYIGCKLSDLAIDLTCDGIEYCPTMIGELDKPEPIALPTLLPLCFLNSMSGIPAGLPKLNIPSLDIAGMFDYYLDILKHKDLNYVPKKLPIPNVGVPILSSKSDWEDVLKTGKGTIRLAPEMEIDKNGTITITAMPASKSAEHVRKIIEKEILLDKVDMRDESTYDTRIVVEKVFKKQCDMQEIYDRLYKKLQTSETYNLAFFDQDHIYVPCSFDLVVKSNLNYLIETHTNRLTHQIMYSLTPDMIEYELTALTAEQFFQQFGSGHNVGGLHNQQVAGSCGIAPEVTLKQNIADVSGGEYTLLPVFDIKGVRTVGRQMIIFESGESYSSDAFRKTVRENSEC